MAAPMLEIGNWIPFVDVTIDTGSNTAKVKLIWAGTKVGPDQLELPTSDQVKNGFLGQL